MMIRGYEIGAKLIAYVVGAVLLVGLIAFGLNQCQGRKTADKQAEVSKGQAGASIDSGSEAMNTVSNVAEADARTDELVGMGQTEIAAASQGTKGKAAKRAACRLKAYRDTPQCKEPVR
jgi:hypothetical protein